MAQQLADGFSAGPRAPSRVLNATLWFLQIAAAAMFLFVGALKLASAPAMVAVFDGVGLGQWFRYVTGALEVLGAAALLVPRLAGAGALLLAAVMVGAVTTHQFIIGGSPFPALVLVAAEGVRCPLP
jgi:uncharacterized membrane protein YphA (DoxX/SURF4 family)